MIKVLLVDDHEMVRMGLAAYLSTQEDIDVIGEASNGKDGIKLATERQPDVILMDLVMDGMNGIEATKAIIEKNPAARIIVLTSFMDDEKVYPVIEAGAMSYLLKTSKAWDISQAIRATFRGEGVMETQVTNKMIQRMRTANQKQPHDQLTVRELEVLKLIADGQSNQDIADTLCITIKTVKTHVSSIFQKLDVYDRTQAAIYALRHHIAE
ncbi:response regulator [Aureibacillus halotolerans]|uniref:LuxR family two component transcriptional regulator n=1 Tax=Aureibacillus halotolerans TaxID=1508390 RepID=A0A4R6U396_9BACI|nr:response regulator transcription factor [Aureibacillus halotolerans]TDQ40481.1 LuxR family two component transcriptional regulator [Aureibacillus halotolerans]